MKAGDKMIDITPVKTPHELFREFNHCIRRYAYIYNGINENSLEHIKARFELMSVYILKHYKGISFIRLNYMLSIELNRLTALLY